ncbi:MAG: ANTAR domain-containing protein [Bryobacteraceae bacterium]|jgi:hypothetical protein
MRSSDLQATEQRYYIRLNDTAAQATQEMGLLLDQLVTRSRADGAVVYRLEAGADEFHAVAVQSRVSPRIPEVGVTLSAGAIAWLKKSQEHLQVLPSIDVPFENLPEVLQYGFRRVLLFPFRAEYDLLGFLTLGRRSGDFFDQQAVDGAQPLVRIVAALLERDALQDAMKERKLVERAKGILQKKERISEENAYLLLRKVSRHRRLPMAEVAREIIQSSENRTALRKTA